MSYMLSKSATALAGPVAPLGLSAYKCGHGKCTGIKHEIMP